MFLKVETVTRDFSKTYKAAIKEALPDAKQIVDRFHILKNLTDDISAYLKRTVGDKLKVTVPASVSIKEKEILNERERWKLETGLRKWETIKEVKRLKKKGRNHSEIARILHLGWSTVIKYLTITEPPIASRPCLLDPFVPRIKELLQKGYTRHKSLIV